MKQFLGPKWFSSLLFFAIFGEHFNNFGETLPGRELQEAFGLYVWYFIMEILYHVWICFFFFIIIIIIFLISSIYI
jgi:hypothetical protein